MAADATTSPRGARASWVQLRIMAVILGINLAGSLLLLFYLSVIDVASHRDLPGAGSWATLMILILPACGSLLYCHLYSRPIFDQLRRMNRPDFQAPGEDVTDRRVLHVRRRALRFPLVSSMSVIVAWAGVGSLVALLLWWAGPHSIDAGASIPGGSTTVGNLLSEQFFVAGSNLKFQWTRLIEALKIVGLGMVVGVIISSLDFFLVETIWQREVPRLFPGGKISALGDSWIIPVRWRLTIIFLLVGAVPLVLFGVLSYQRARAMIYMRPEDVLGNLLLFNLFMVAFGIGLAVVLSRFVARSVSEPLEKLREGMERVKQGYLWLQVPVKANDELGRVTEGFNDMVRALGEKESSISGLTQGLEEKVKERTRELEEALTEKEMTQAQLIHAEKMASLGQLVAGVAHELNNPLGYIYANTDHLERFLARLTEAVDHASPEEVNQNARKLEQVIQSTRDGARRAKEIVAGLRTFSRKGVYSRQPVDLREVIELAIMLLSHELKRGITVERDYGELPLIEANSGELSQVFINLIGNAAQAVKDDGVIRIETRAEGDEAVVRVHDNGSGIAPEHLSRIFEPFFTTKEVGKGTGLGLAITYGIIRSHGGEIRVESEPGRGTLMEIRLPLGPAAEASAPAGEA